MCDLWQHFRDKMGDAFDEDEVVPVKQVWKWIFPKKMEAAVGKRFVTGESCQFYIELQVRQGVLRRGSFLIKFSTSQKKFRP